MSHPIGMVFIHGAGLDSSVWDELRAHIQVPVLVIEFPNRGQGDKANTTTTFDGYVRSAAEQIRAWNKAPFILITHSIGAIVGLKLAAQFRTELRGFVAIGSVVPQSGNSFVSSLPFPQRMMLPVVLKLMGTKPPPSAIASELCNDLSAEQTRAVVDGFTAESRALYTTRIVYELPKAKRLYVALSDDRSITLPLQERMAKNLQADEVVTLASGHLPMLSKPRELSKVLADFLEGVVAERGRTTNEPGAM